MYKLCILIVMLAILLPVTTFGADVAKVRQAVTGTFELRLVVDDDGKIDVRNCEIELDKIE